MAKSLPPLTWFRTFEAAGRLLSFTAAADEIGMTQSAVSQQVKSLEHRLGSALFTRHARGLSLTDEGRRLLPQIETALAQLATATEAFRPDRAQNLLTIAASVSMIQWVISPNLQSFSRRYPEISLRYVSTIWPDDFHTARADVEIRFGSEKQVGKDATLLTPNRLVALKSQRVQGDLRTLPLIEAVGTSDGWRAWAHHVADTPRPTIFADSYGVALQLAAHGNGIALVSTILTGHAITSGQVERAHPSDCPATEGYYLSINEKEPAAGLFQEWLQHVLEQQG